MRWQFHTSPNDVSKRKRSQFGAIVEFTCTAYLFTDILLIRKSWPLETHFEVISYFLFHLRLSMILERRAGLASKNIPGDLERFHKTIITKRIMISTEKKRKGKQEMDILLVEPDDGKEIEKGIKEERKERM